MGVNYSLFVPDVQKAAQDSGVPASLTLAQIILESGGTYANGLSGLASNYKNLFGVKGTGSGGSISMPTMEVKNGSYVQEKANFRVYNSYYDSIMDHNRLLKTDRYTAKTKSATTVEEYAKAIHAAGYATDPKYSDKLISIINQYNLKQYDSGVTLPKGVTQQNFGEGTDTSNSNANNGAPSYEEQQNDKKSFTENVFFNVTRVLAIGGLIVLLFVFFLKAFPPVEDLAKNVVPITKATKVVKKVKTVKNLKG